MKRKTETRASRADRSISTGSHYLTFDLQMSNPFVNIPSNILLGMMHAISVIYQTSFLYENETIPTFTYMEVLFRLFSILLVTNILRHALLKIPLSYWPRPAFLSEINVRQYVLDAVFFPLNVVIVCIQFDVHAKLWPAWWPLLHEKCFDYYKV
jgi:hypothetical protein